MTVDPGLEARLMGAIDTSSDPKSLRIDLDLFLPACTLALSRTVPTACIRRQGHRYRIEFGKDFLDQHLRDDRDLLFVLLHECFHHVLGHLTASAAPRDPRMEQAANVAADMLVNRAVCQRFFPDGVPLLDRLYPRTDLVGALLRQPLRDVASEHRAFVAGLTRAGCPEDLVEQAWHVRYNGWFLAIPFAMLLSQVVDLLRNAGLIPTVVFLGNHEQEDERIPGLPWDDEEFGAGRYDNLEEDELEEPVEPQVSPELAQAVRSALVSDPCHRARRVVHTPVTSPVFSPGRSDWPFLSLGYWPTLFHGPRRDTSEDDHRARVYVDVSGSFDEYVGRVYGLLLALADDVGSPVHLFSNVVEDVTLEDLARGLRRSTGGTDFDCVFQHALDHHYRQIVVITDGLGGLDSGLSEAFQSAGASLYLVILGGTPEQAAMWSPLPALARGVWGLG